MFPRSKEKKKKKSSLILPHHALWWFLFWYVCTQSCPCAAIKSTTSCETPPSTTPPSVCFLPLELSRQDVAHAAQNGLVLPRPFQVELKAADAAALIARLLGFCGHVWFLWGKKNDSLLHSGRTNLTVRSKHARSRPVTSEQRRVDTGGDFFQLSVNLHRYSSLAPASEAHSLLLHNSCKLNFASISEAAAAVRHFQSRSLISAGRAPSFISSLCQRSESGH